ncbi:hypothetical protein Verru16b_00149 [Lacunisphaera limnophila]|uniref:Uncharacterized protein n=1 Tax=Lacunisphaera limnophila TaxID=1838286 RepID=A0A1I7PHM1_9BACT|nr:DUF6580 family putative transport protein [Lacunisphaera limnophila]AOS43108.1 hypothetical protein Verru16b_00149 [Lacunisphaera limnophila]
MRNAALILIILALGYRLLPTLDMAWANFPPLMALAFCGSVYFRNRWMWLIPFAGLCLTDLYINWFYAREYGYHWELSGFIARAASFGLALGLGTWVSRRKSWLWLLNGSLIGALVFYFITNTQSWFSDPFYAKSLAGWWQAMTIGHPEYPPTIFFFRNTLFGDLMFTGIFAGVMEWLAKRAEEPSLLDHETEEAEDEEKPAEVEVKD